MRHLHVSREARRRFDLPPAEFGLFGQVMLLEHRDAAEWAKRVRSRLSREAAADVRPPDVAPPDVTPPDVPTVGFTAGQLLAAAALHELMHALIEVETAPDGPQASRWQAAVDAAKEVRGARALQELSTAFATSFEPASSLRDREPLPGSADPDGTAAVTPLDALLEEMLLLDLARSNPALRPLRVLFQVPGLLEREGYGVTLAAARAELAGSGPDPDLLQLLASPQEREPDSLARQLQVALDLWGPRLRPRYGRALGQAVTALDVLAEEARPAWGPPGPPPAPPWSLVGEDEPEAYSADAPWMPGVVLVAKSTHVWLAQLSQRFGTRVTTLDAVPAEALAELRQQGFNALWLIGVWRRSAASRKVKQLKGQADAMASAYSVMEYVVSPELGGEEALARLSERAARHGLRLASDMVPNHTAMDSEWLMENPDWFVQTDTPPFPSYSFAGPDLSEDPRVTLRLEDHYYDGSDAAVVFQRVDNLTGEERYVYHGNDGTALPWNDTAQLDYLRPDVRRAVIETTVAVARRFPLIRLDAAMTLARRHYRRLWHPLPGDGGAVPSRAALGLPPAEFDARMPREFWRELVDTLAVEAPGTMLLAEAFWLMEVYFVRSLGMNRVYNSAFMHSTLEERNAEYRAYLKRYLLEAPAVLARFVNYMSNPDEESAAEQFGDGDKAFGVATLMATLPGLPMFGHGQVEGLREKYGMEFSRPRTAEAPREWHVQRHLRQIAPLLERRELFAGNEAFRLFDLVAADGSVQEDVYAFVNGQGDERVLVVYNNSPKRVAGRLHRAAPTLMAGGDVRSDSLLQALGLESAAHAGKMVVLESLAGDRRQVAAAELASQGMTFDLGPYEAQVHLRVWLERPSVAPQEPAPVAAGGRRAINLAVLGGRRGVAARRRSARRKR